VLKEREAARENEKAEIDKRLLKATRNAKSDIASAIDQLEQLVAIEPSMERTSLLGSAYKRLALIAESEEDAKAEAAAIAAMRTYYEQAERIGREHKLSDFFYPALNRLSAEFALGNGPVQLDPQAVAAIRANLESAVRDKPDFWSVVGQTELLVYEALERGDLAAQASTIIAAYDDLQLRIQTEWMWASVYDQAQFVLPKYAKRASPNEREAAKRVIDRLATLSGRPPSDSTPTLETAPGSVGTSPSRRSAGTRTARRRGSRSRR